MSGMQYTIDNVPTPAMVIHVPTAVANVKRMAGYCASHGLKLRPHTKTHKSIFMARQQLEAGASGLTVAKVGEAEVLTEAWGNNEADILIAFPTLDPARAQRVVTLAKRATVRVAVDSIFAAQAIANAASANSVSVGILVDVDTGFARTGVQSPEDATAIAQFADSTKGLRFDGLFTFPGHIRDDSHAIEVLPEVDRILADTIAACRDAGLDCPIVSGGSTPSAMQSHLVKSYTEIRPGTYIYNDRNCLDKHLCHRADAAAWLICTVVSDAVPGKCVLDGGSKTFTNDMYLGKVAMDHGLLDGYDAAVLNKLTEEHGEVDLVACANSRPKLGQRVRVLMNHVCPAVNLQSKVWFDYGEGKLEASPVDARGKLS